MSSMSSLGGTRSAVAHQLPVSTVDVRVQEKNRRLDICQSSGGASKLRVG